MKLRELIENADALEPNQYSFEQKLGWLSTLDGQIYREVTLTHEPGGTGSCGAAPDTGDGGSGTQDSAPDDTDGTFVPGLAPYPDGEREPIVPFPYQELYVHYLRAQIALNNGEAARANQYIAQYNAAFMQWQNACSRARMPRETGRFRI